MVDGLNRALVSLDASIWPSNASVEGGKRGKMLLGNGHEQAFELDIVPKCVPCGDLEERTVVPHTAYCSC